jgi:hypothetical protein
VIPSHFQAPYRIVSTTTRRWKPSFSGSIAEARNMSDALEPRDFN